MRRALSLALLGVFLSSPALASVQYTYDTLGRVVSVTYDNGGQITYSYDAAGNRSATVASGFPNSGGSSGGAIMVLPLNGFLVVQLPG